MASAERSARPNFHADALAARQYDAYVRESPLYGGLVRELLARARIAAGDSVLCLAAGTGFDARAAAEAGAAEVLGLDQSLSMVAAARSAGDEAPVRYVRGDAAAIPFPSERFDVVLINAAGNYLWDSSYRLFCDIRRVLRPGGRLAFNCQSDELEDAHAADPQRAVRRLTYLLGQRRGYAVRLSARPTVPFLADVARAAGLMLREAEAVRIPTTLPDVLAQLRLPQFAEPFLGALASDERDALLGEAAAMAARAGVEPHRSWHFFTFEREG